MKVKMNELNRKTISTLVIMILMLSMALPAIPLASALGTLTFEDPEGVTITGGKVGDTVTVTVSDTTPGGLVKIYWDSVKAWDGKAGLLAEDHAVGDEANIEIVIPEAVQGEHYVIAKDVESGLTKYDTFTVTGKITLTPVEALAGDTVTVTGTGFAAGNDIGIFFVDPTVRLIQSGLSTAKWATDPATSPTHGYVVKLVGAADSDARAGVLVTSTLDVGAVNLAQLGFGYYTTAGTKIPDLELRFVAPDCLDPDDETSLDRAHMDVTITPAGDVTPSVWTLATIQGSNSVSVFGNDPSTGTAWSYTGTYSGLVTWLSSGGGGAAHGAALSWVLTRVAPQVGWTVTGTYYIDDVKVENIIYDLARPIKTTSSDPLGSFTATFNVPSEAETGTVSAIGETDLFADETLTVVTSIITLTPDRGLVGATVTVAGRGFTPDEAVDIRWYTTGTLFITLKTNVAIEGNGEFSTTFKVPSVPDPVAPVEYTVKAVDEDDGLTEATFTVAEEASITLDPKNGQPEDLFGVSGEWFTESSDVTITFDGVEIGTADTDDDGAFTATDLEVPDVSEGIYTVKATDEEGVTASATFKVIVPKIEIRTRATEYLPGDIISIYGNCSKAKDGVLLITDPNGVIFCGLPIDDETSWMEISDWYVMPYCTSDHGMLFCPLPSDAPLGSWNFTAYDVNDEILDTNLFTVVASPSIQTVLDRLDELDASITDLVMTSDGDTMALITTTSGDILSNLNDIDTKIVGLASHAGDNYVLLNTTLGELEVKLDYIKPLITKIEGDVVTINTVLGTLSGKVTTIEGNVATIATDVGTIKVDISAVTTAATTTGTKADSALTAAQAATTAAQAATAAANAAKAATDGLTTLVYGAIGASLIAAIAAIVALMQISKKIA